jgi:RNA polymerase sigma factor (sigma-70 family)
MKTKLTELVIQYKKHKSDNLFNQIYSLLKKSIKDKTSYLFYQKKFRGIRLCDTKQIDEGDIFGELNLTLLEIINKYNPAKGSFDSYWFSTLWNFKPKSINQDFFNNLKNSRTYKINSNDEEESIIDGMAVNPDIEEISIYELFDNLDDEEKKLIKILKKKLGITQSELAEIMKVSQQEISRMYESIKQKYKKFW